MNKPAKFELPAKIVPMTARADEVYTENVATRHADRAIAIFCADYPNRRIVGMAQTDTGWGIDYIFSKRRVAPNRVSYGE